MFKTNLIEAVQRKRVLEEGLYTAMARVAQALGFNNHGSWASSNTGHEVRGDSDGYLNLFFNGKHTGIRAAHYDGENGFIRKAIDFIRGK